MERINIRLLEVINNNNIKIYSHAQAYELGEYLTGKKIGIWKSIFEEEEM